MANGLEGLKVLIVDDEPRMRKLIHDYLEAAGASILEAADGEAALDIFMGVKGIDLILLDVMMPKKDGWEVCQEIRESSKVPIIMLTAKNEEKDELKGFQLGVDEYITKPFSPKVLLARIEAIIRRSQLTEESESIEINGITIDTQARKVSIGEENVELSFKEYELLLYLINHKGVAMSREKILTQVWDYDYYGDTRTIDTHIKKLRQKLKDKGDIITTVRNIGYMVEER